MVGEEVKIVWNHHFGPRFIMGKEFGKEMESVTDEKLKIIKSDRHVAEKVVSMYKQKHLMKMIMTTTLRLKQPRKVKRKLM